MMQKMNFIIALALLPTPATVCAEEHSGKPLAIHHAVGLPEWLKFSVEHRTRYETLSNTFKPNGNGGDQVLAFRTQVFFEVAYEKYRLGAEFIDSRTGLDDSGTPANTTLVNETDLLQAYLGWQTDDFFGSGLGMEMKFGRQTMDVGSRRLVARNRYRNTINNFNGLDFTVESQNNWDWRNFVVLPVSRLPNDSILIRNGGAEFDEENFNVIFAGSFFGRKNLPFDSVGELFFFQLSEDDTGSTSSKNRNLSTPGLRWRREAKLNRLDFELESALQTGTSRAGSSASDTAKLNHFSYFGHAVVGYTFDLPWTPRFLLQYDYASGDEDPDDGKNGRFETLFGARRFEFGPTSIWGAFARANINTPGVRIEIQPMPDVAAFIAHRAYWLAEKRDEWVGSGLRDATGESGSFIGQQLEARLRWNAIPETLTLETGWAHLFKGRFAKNAPGSPENKDDSDYFYAQTSLAF